MNCLSRNSLYATLDSISELLFFKHQIPESQRVAAARWIASRQGLAGSYAGMFAPTEQDTLGIHLFTGEAVRSRAGVAHILGEEGCRILALLHVPELAKGEMQYAALYWRNNLKRLAAAGSSVARRRAAVGQRLLELCET